MSSLRKTSQGYRWPIENPHICNAAGPLNGKVKMGRLILRNVDLFWPREDEAKVIEMWKRGVHVADIAETVGRDVDEVGLLLYEQGMQGYIGHRPGGVLGSEASS